MLESRITFKENNLNEQLDTIISLTRKAAMKEYELLVYDDLPDANKLMLEVAELQKQIEIIKNQILNNFRK